MNQADKLYQESLAYLAEIYLQIKTYNTLLHSLQKCVDTMDEELQTRFHASTLHFGLLCQKIEVVELEVEQFKNHEILLQSPHAFLAVMVGKVTECVKKLQDIANEDDI